MCGLKNRKIRHTAGIFLIAAVLLLTGCTRSQINYQVAKSIGTLGMYENNEPVETPKMKAEREFREAEEEKEQHLLATIEQADYLARGYWYEDAVQYLKEADIDQEDERVTSAISRYQKAEESLYEYDGKIPQLCFPTLITDTTRAFEESGNGSSYRSVMITVTEFQNILQQMYDSGYMLIDIHELMEKVTDDSGRISYYQVSPRIPEGKKPFILSIDKLDYSSVIKNGDGIAMRLTLNDDGEVKALYTDEGGHDLKGDYDVVPIVETFVKEHPDFSYRGARGIIGVSGSEGIFGYEVEDDGATDYSKNRETVKEISRKLRADGWMVACETYSYGYVNDMSLETLTDDLSKWKSVVKPLVGETDVMMYPYGSEISNYEDTKGNLLLEEGFQYFIGLWASDDFLAVEQDYLRMMRRMINGYVFQNSPNLLDSFFSVAAILDPAR